MDRRSLARCFKQDIARPSATGQQKSQEAIQTFIIINQSWNAYEKRTPASPARNKKSRRRGSIHDR